MKKAYLDYGGKGQTMEVDLSFVQVYTDSLTLSYSISSACTNHLLQWILFHMTKYNQIILSKANRDDFVASTVKHTKRKYVDQTVRVSVNELVRKGMIISMNDEGRRESLYMVNPSLFWKSSKKADRIESIRAFNYKNKQT